MIHTKIQSLGEKSKQHITTFPIQLIRIFNLQTGQKLIWEDATELIGIPAIMIFPVPETTNRKKYYSKLKQEGILE